MKNRINTGFPVLSACLVILVGLTGCATGGGNGSRGKLSDATAQSAGQEEGKGRDQGRSRTKNDVQTSSLSDDGYYEEEESDSGSSFLAGLILSLFSGGDDDEVSQEALNSYPADNRGTGRGTWSDNGEIGSFAEKESPGEAPDHGLDITRSNLNFWYSRSRPAGDAISRFSTFTLMYSGYTGPRYRAHAGIYYGRGKAGSQANVKDGLRWISEAGIDVGSRGYFTPDHSLLGVYMLVGLRVGALYWSYHTALEAPAEEGTSEQISKDGLMMFTPYVGLGTSLVQTKSFHLGVNFTVGGRLTVDKTFENYENDVFKHVGEYKLNLEASFFF